MKRDTTITTTLLVHGSDASAGDFIAPNPTHSCRERSTRLLFLLNESSQKHKIRLQVTSARNVVLEAYKNAQIYQNYSKLIFEAVLLQQGGAP